jgi:large subunit ribosomal protein L25
MLEGIVRESTSKSATKQYRRDGYLIANIYGKGVENVSAAFKYSDFIRYVRNKESFAFDVKVGDTTHKVVIQEYQREPISGEFVHVDLMVVVPGHSTYYQVPITTTGTPKGLKNKGVMVYHKRRLKVKCAAEDLPNGYNLDVTDLDVGDNILIRDVDLGANVETFLSPSVPLVGVIKAK